MGEGVHNGHPRVLPVVWVAETQETNGKGGPRENNASAAATSSRKPRPFMVSQNGRRIINREPLSDTHLRFPSTPSEN